MLCDREVLGTYRKALSGEHFTDESFRWIAESAIKVFDAAGSIPSRASLLDATQDDPPAGLDSDEVEAEIGALYEDGAPDDREYVLARIIEFATYQGLRRAVGHADEMLQAGSYAEWVDEVNRAANIAVVGNVEDLEYGEDTIDVVERLYEGSKPTGIGDDALDQHFDGRGLCAGELGLFLGLPGFHKTTALMTVGKSALARGEKVAHFTFEVSAAKLATRYNCAILGRTKSEMMLHKDKAKEAVRGLLAECGGSLRICYAPENEMTLVGLEARLKMWQSAHGWKPDIILVDYGALLKPSHHYDGVLRFQHAELYNGLRRIAGVWKVPVWSAQQAGREGEKAMKAGGVLSMMNAAEAFEPIRRADIVVSLNQTDEERGDGVMRLHGAKVREGQGGFTETVRIDPTRYTFRPLVNKAPPPPPPDDEDDGGRPPEPPEGE